MKCSSCGGEFYGPYVSQEIDKKSNPCGYVTHCVDCGKEYVLVPVERREDK